MRQRTQVAIIGAGPSGLMLGRLLELAGIDNIIVERQSREYVLGRIRAGILEQTTVDLLHQAKAADNLKANGILHNGVNIAYDGKWRKIELSNLTNGKCVTAYGQTEVTKDLADIRYTSDCTTIYQADNVAIHDLTSNKPYLSYELDGETHQIDCELIAGCDGYHGVSRQSIPKDAISTYEKTYPFGWLGVLSDTPPVAHEVVYANHSRGFALCSMRSWTRSRYYIQCPVDDNADAWSDTMFWDEFRRRLPDDLAESLITGPSIEKSVAPLRSFVAEPLRYGPLFLVGDAAHIVPPTGAKGLNLAASDVHYLFNALRSHFEENDTAALDTYSEKALQRIWKTERFAWSLTNLTHRFNDDPFEQKMKEAELEYMTTSEVGRQMLAENYVGLPL